MNVPLLDLRAQYHSIKSDIDSAIERVVDSQHFIMGPEVDALEKDLQRYLNCRHAIAVSSGTDALLVALMALDIKSGDEVIVPTYSFFATAGVVARLQATPVFADIDPVTFNIDPADVARKLSSRTKAIIPVHLYGQSADMSAIMEIARQKGIPVVEDAAQAIGVDGEEGRRVGTTGAIGCFSFFPSKNLGCFGDGGLVTTENDGLAEQLRILRVHGGKPKYFHKVIGGNFRLDAIQAAVLRAKLPRLDEWSAARRRNADLYTRLFVEAGLATGEGQTELSGREKVLLPKAVYRSSGIRNYHIYNQYVIRVKDRDGLKKHLTENGIGNEIYYPVPFHRQECFRYLGQEDSKFPASNFAAEHSLALPIYPELTEEQVRYVVRIIASFVR